MLKFVPRSHHNLILFFGSLRSTKKHFLSCHLFLLILGYSQLCLSPVCHWWFCLLLERIGWLSALNTVSSNLRLREGRREERNCLFWKSNPGCSGSGSFLSPRWLSRVEAERADTVWLHGSAKARDDERKSKLEVLSLRLLSPFRDFSLRDDARWLEVEMLGRKWGLIHLCGTELPFRNGKCHFTNVNYWQK